MKIALIGCMVFARDISHILVNSKHKIHPFWLEQGLHDTPQLLQKKIQEKINEIEELKDINTGIALFDTIVLAYGLCSNGIVGLTSKKLPIVAPRCDDCMALFLGSQEKYLDIFTSYKGVYWFNKAWCENEFIPSKERYDQMYKNYVEEYGEENADFLLDSDMSFTKNYENAFFIKSNIYDDAIERKNVKENADYFKWQYIEVEANNSFILDLMNGNWDDRFVVCKPNQKIVADYTGLKIKAE